MRTTYSKICEQCGKSFTATSRNENARMCSRSCAAKSGKGKTGRSPKHGGCSGGLSVLYRRWDGIKRRCCCPSHNKYSRYGGRGITLCKEWMDFSVFEKWALANGFKDTLQIDRIDNEKGYSPDNCRWVTPSQNCRNKRNNIRLSDGRVLADAAEGVGLSSKIVSYRIKTGVPESLALNLPITPNGTKRKFFKKLWTPND